MSGLHFIYWSCTETMWCVDWLVIAHHKYNNYCFQIFYILCRVNVIEIMTRCFENNNYSVGRIYYLPCCALVHARTLTLTLYTGTWLIPGMVLRPMRFGSFLIIFIWKLCKSVMFRRPLKWCVCVCRRTWCRVFQLFPWNDYII